MTDPAPSGHDVLEGFRQTVSCCAKQLDAFQLALQAANELGATAGAICLADAALEGKLVVRLSFGLEGASNKVLQASSTSPAAALRAYSQNHAIIINDFASSGLGPTDLEQRLGVRAAAYLPIPAETGETARGIMLAVMDPTQPSSPEQAKTLGDLAAALGNSLPRLTAPNDAPETHLPAGAGSLRPLLDAFRACLDAADIETASDRTLEYCLSFTQSEFGFVGYLDPATGFLIAPTMTHGIFAQCQVAGKTTVFEKPGGLGGWVLDCKAPLVANDPLSHPASVGTPPGHLPIRKFLGTPCISKGRMVGMIALANRDSDYGAEELEIANAFADIYASSVARFFSERELTASRNRFSSLYQDAPCGYHTIAPDGTILEVNDTALDLLGRGRDDLVGKINVNELLTTTGQRLLAEQIRAVTEGSTPPIELHFKHADGTRFPVLQSALATKDERGYLRDIRCTMVDIRIRRQYEVSLRRVNRALKTLSKSNEALVHATHEDELLNQVCRILVETGGYRIAWIGFAQHDDAKTVLPVARAGAESGYLDEIDISWDDTPRGHGPTGTAIRTGLPQVAQDIGADPRFLSWREQALRHGFASSISIPLIKDGTAFGAINLYAEETHAFDGDEVHLLVELAADLAFGVSTLRARQEHQALTEEKEHYLRQLKESMEGTIQAVASTVEKRDPYTAGHQQRVARLARAIAQEMGLSEHQIEGVHLGAIIHDIGKISIPAEILNKPGRLGDLEFLLIQSHAAAGKEILQGVHFPWPIAEMVNQHHERLDGSGYPNGLKGDEILLEARILAVADVVEAMSSHRPYRPSLGMNAALDEISRNRGRLYDPESVDICLRIIRDEGFRLEA